MLDCLIQNAQIIDGSGGPPYVSDLAIRDGRIAALGALPGQEARQVVDADGRCLTPGFIDVHRHGDGAVFRADFGKAELAQGLTTILNGNCGLSAAPISGPHARKLCSYLAPITGPLPQGPAFASLDAYLRAVERQPLGLNCGMLVGMGTLRACVAGFSPGSLDRDQLRRLHTLLETALADGALGVSLGLGYAPECFYSTEELIRALEPLHRSGVVLTVHMRQEGDGVTAALREMLTVAEALETPVEISHLKAIGRRNWRRAVPEMLSLLAQARAGGLDVSCDCYPYTAGSTQLLHVLPPEAQRGGIDALTDQLSDPAARAALRRRMETGTDFENITALVGFENIRATSLRLPRDLPFEGRSLAEIAQALGQDPYDALFDLLLREECGVSMIDFIAHEDDIADILRAPFSGVISDATYPTEGLLHPRVYGTFPRLLEVWVRQRGVLTLPEAIHKITRRSADRFGLPQKGRIAPGADADLCLFDPALFRESGTYAQPDRLARGMDWVFVGGRAVIAQGTFTGETPGAVLRR